MDRKQRALFLVVQNDNENLRRQVSGETVWVNMRDEVLIIMLGDKPIVGGMIGPDVRIFYNRGRSILQSIGIQTLLQKMHIPATAVVTLMIPEDQGMKIIISHGISIEYDHLLRMPITEKLCLQIFDRVLCLLPALIPENISHKN